MKHRLLFMLLVGIFSSAATFADDLFPISAKTPGGDRSYTAYVSTDANGITGVGLKGGGSATLAQISKGFVTIMTAQAAVVKISALSVKAEPGFSARDGGTIVLKYHGGSSNPRILIQRVGRDFVAYDAANHTAIRGANVNAGFTSSTFKFVY